MDGISRQKKEKALFHLENAIACLKWGFEEDAETNAIEAQSILEGVKFADLIEGKDYIDLEKRQTVICADCGNVAKLWSEDESTRPASHCGCWADCEECGTITGIERCNCPKTANSNMIGHPEGVEEGDIVEYRYYPDPKMHRAIVAWNAEEGRYVLQTFRREEVNRFKADGISDYCDLDQADKIIILGSTHQM